MSTHTHIATISHDIANTCIANAPGILKIRWLSHVFDPFGDFGLRPVARTTANRRSKLSFSPQMYEGSRAETMIQEKEKTLSELAPDWFWMRLGLAPAWPGPFF